MSMQYDIPNMLCQFEIRFKLFFAGITNKWPICFPRHATVATMMMLVQVALIGKCCSTSAIQQNQSFNLQTECNQHGRLFHIMLFVVHNFVEVQTWPATLLQLVALGTGGQNATITVTMDTVTSQSILTHYTGMARLFDGQTASGLIVLPDQGKQSCILPWCTQSFVLGVSSGPHHILGEQCVCAAKDDLTHQQTKGLGKLLTSNGLQSGSVYCMSCYLCFEGFSSNFSLQKI